MKYRFDGKEKRLSVGTYPDTSLKAARAKRDSMKADIAAGIDPAAERKKDKEAEAVERIKSENTFEKVARERLEKVRDTISEGHYTRQLTAFENDAFPLIGSQHIDDVTAPDLVALLHRMEERGANESARKLFYSISKRLNGRWRMVKQCETRRQILTSPNCWAANQKTTTRRLRMTKA